jgi:serine/threonine protein kinase/Tol biopolymer transport system component
VNPERWRQIEELYHAALLRTEGERVPFLAQACGGDAALRREVESLLAQAASTGRVVDGVELAFTPAAESVRAPVSTAWRLGIYEVQTLLGAGGMGTVYRAIDTKLNRPVAIKFLSDHLADPAARRRFQREAQTASSLNHPHIVTVHDAGEFEGRQYLVTEFVDGGTLKDWLAEARRAWPQVLELLIGVADGLAAAHDAGILHRDIKPANILIARNGYAKLADFGLAKLQDDNRQGATEARRDQPTRTGMIVGTIAYMSPEQASGQALDARSDIFSFGVVLYEVLTGQRPFTGATDLDLLQAIARRQPPPLPETLPLALRVLIEKALEKNPANRFQSMREMVVDLRRLWRQTADTPQELTHGSRSRRLIPWLGAGTLAAVLVAGVWLASRTPAERREPRYTQLTNFADSAVSPALSPDGRMLAFIRGPDTTLAGPGQIYVKLLPDGEAVQLTNDRLEKMGPVFSPDGARIAYTAVDNTGFSTMDTWIVSPLGGQEPQRQLTNAEGLTWIRTPATSSSSVLFSVMTGVGAQMSIVSANESRGDLRTIYEPRPPDGMAHKSYASPNGEWLLVAEMDIRSWLPCRLLRIDGKTQGTPVGPIPAQCTHAAWSPDGAWMYFTARTTDGIHIWRQRFPDGNPEQVTSGVTTEEGIAFAPDGRSFVTSIGTSQSTVWVRDDRGERQMTSEGYGFLPSISPDAKAVYFLVRSFGIRSWTQGSLWSLDMSTGQRRRLLPDFQMLHYTISRDGERVVFVAVDEQGRSPVWIAPVNGQTPPRRLTTIDAGSAVFGAPGEVLFSDLENGFVYRVREDGSGLQQATGAGAQILFAASPDGKWVSVQDTKEFGALMVYPTNGGAPRRLCGLCSSPQGDDWIPPPVSWSPDGTHVYLRFSGSTFAVPLRGGDMLPLVPEGGFRSKEAVAALTGARLISEAEGVYSGPHPTIHALLKVSTQRNLYRIPVP